MNLRVPLPGLFPPTPSSARLRQGFFDSRKELAMKELFLAVFFLAAIFGTTIQ